MSRYPCCGLAGLLATVAFGTAFGSGFRDWDVVPDRSAQPTCLDIPSNMTLCRDIGYPRMKLPNLLDHDSLSEIYQQAASWVPLLNLRCDPDLQLFLCSLFAPICLERSIYPCRSLCQKVERSCGGTMLQYGFPWPDMVRCDKFPLDNDMCIKAQSGEQASDAPLSETCNACNQPETKENILDHFCRSDIVVRTKFRRIRRTRLISGKSKVFKPQKASREERRRLRRPQFRWTHDPACCAAVKPRAGRYLVMARRDSEHLVPTLVMPWNRTRLFRKVRRLFRNLDCNDPRAIREALLPPAASGRPLLPAGRSAGRGGRRRAGRRRWLRRRPGNPNRRRRGRRRKQGRRRRPDQRRRRPAGPARGHQSTLAPTTSARSD